MINDADQLHREAFRLNSLSLSARWHTRTEVSFLVRTELLVGRPVQMDGQVGNSHDGPVDVDETMMQLPVGGLDENAAGDL